MADPLRIYHNPRCSKSRQTLALIENAGQSPDVILYLETPPTTAELKSLLKKLGMSARDLMRKGESDYKENNLADSSVTEDQLIQAMVKYPKLIERPIVVKGDQAILGRPPENVNELL